MPKFLRKYYVAAIAISLAVGLVACSEENEPVPPTTTQAVQPTSTLEATQPPAQFAPIFSVSTIDGENILLEDLLGKIPVYLLFIPSTTDELDKNQMKSIQARYTDFERMDATVVVVVSELPTDVIDTRDELGIQFALIADPLDLVAADWQVFDLDGEGLVSPASFVFNAHGSLVARLIATTPADRPSVDEVLFVIEESLSTGAA